MWLTVLLFVVLSPGLFFHIGRGFLESVLIHAAIFGLCVYALKRYFTRVRIEGFQDKHVEGWKLGNSCGDDYCMSPKYYCKENSKGVKYCSETE